MVKFPRGTKYKIITVDTELKKVEEMLKKTLAVFVSDEEGKFVLGVVTKSDLVKFYQTVSFK